MMDAGLSARGDKIPRNRRMPWATPKTKELAFEELCKLYSNLSTGIQVMCLAVRSCFNPWQ